MEANEKKRKWGKYFPVYGKTGIVGGYRFLRVLSF